MKRKTYILLVAIFAFLSVLFIQLNVMSLGIIFLITESYFVFLYFKSSKQKT